MVKHIVLFQLASEMEAERKKNVMDAFKKGIETLPAKIPFIRKQRLPQRKQPAGGEDPRGRRRGF